MTIFIEPKKKICIYCGKKVDGLFQYKFLTYDYKTRKRVTKDGIDFVYPDDYYHIKCAIKNLEKDK